MGSVLESNFGGSFLLSMFICAKRLLEGFSLFIAVNLLMQQKRTVKFVAPFPAEPNTWPRDARGQNEAEAFLVGFGAPPNQKTSYAKGRRVFNTYRGKSLKRKKFLKTFDPFEYILVDL